MKSGVSKVDRAIGSRVKLLRDARGISRAELGDALDVSEQQVRKYETGASRIPASMILTIARTFKLPVGELFDPFVVSSERSQEEAGLYAFLGSAEGRTLLGLFQGIERGDVRRAVVAFVKMLADR